MMVDIVRGFARAIDALNPVWNNNSLAHPNTLLEPSDVTPYPAPLHTPAPKRDRCKRALQCYISAVGGLMFSFPFFLLIRCFAT
jgi:hypothetical protein